MLNRIWLVFSISCPLMFLGCATHPHVEADLSGLGSAQIGKTIARNFGNSSESVKKKLSDLLSDRKISDASDRKAALEEIGLNCEKDPVCTYHGTASSKLICADGTILPHNKILDTYDIITDHSGKIIKSTISIVSSPNQN